MGDLLWIVLLAAVYVVLKYRSAWINQLIVTVAGGAIGRAALASQPDTLTLEPAEAGSDSAAARGAFDALKQRGFTPAGTFTIREMGGMPVQFAVRDEESAIAVVYDHPKAGVWTDIVCRYQDGKRFTVTNAKVGGALDPRPGHVTVRKPGLSTIALHMTFAREKPAGSLMRVIPGDVPRVFADAYADEIAWRKDRGVSKDEVRGVAREMEEPQFEHSDASVA